MTQTRQEWLEARRNGLGGSDAAVIMGVNPWTSPYALWCDKRGLLNDADEQSERMMWGNKLEGVIAEHYTEVTQRDLKPGSNLQPSTERPHLFANTDRTIAGFDARGDGVYEGKTTSVYNKDDWADGKVPLYYQCQGQHYAYVLGLEWGSYAVLIGGQEFRWSDFDRNEKYLAKYLARADEFWDRVLNDDPPPMDGHASERAALANLYPEHAEGLTIELPDEAEAWVEILDGAKAAEKAAKGEKARAETLLRGAMRDALFGRLPDGSGFKLALETKKEHVRAASSSRVLRRVKKVPA